jgi:hypothetical protein
MNTKIKKEIALGFIIIAAIAVSCIVYLSEKQATQAPVSDNSNQNKKVCTEEVKQCSDGSYVSRSGPNCEFAVCPNNDADCAKEGESIGAVVPDAKLRKCCDGLTPVVPKNIVGTQGICRKTVDVNFPAENQAVSSPVSISGQVRGTWFFEGSFPVEVYDDSNELLGSGTAQFVPSAEEPEWMTKDFVNFSGSIKFLNTSATSGYILFKKDNPSGLTENDESFKLSIKFIN